MIPTSFNTLPVFPGQNPDIFPGQTQTQTYEMENKMDLDDLEINTKPYNNFNNDLFSVVDNTKNTQQIFEIVKLDKPPTVSEKSSATQFNFKEKVKIPYLKKFNPRSIKREEIDKKVIRKFKKFLKEKIKCKKFNEFHFNLNFWRDFTTKNLLPPMFYTIDDVQYEFKSFNSNYIVWLFSQSEARVLYLKFLEEKKDEMYDSLKEMIKLSITDDIVIELTNIFEYIQCFGEIYSIHKGNESVNIVNNKIKEEKLIDNNELVSPKEPTIANSNEEVFNSENYYENIKDCISTLNNHEQEEEYQEGVSCFQDIDFFKK